MLKIKTKVPFFALLTLFVHISGLPRANGEKLICNELFQSKSYYKEMYPISMETDNLLETKLKNKKGNDKKIKINFSGKFKAHYTTHFIKTGPNDGQLTEINVYGYPYVHEGKTYIDFSINFTEMNTSPDDSRLVLRRMLFEDFLENVWASGNDYQSNDFILIGKQEKKGFSHAFRHGTVISRDEKSAIVQTSKGRETYSIEDINRWNILLSYSETKHYSNFFSKEGQGELFYVDRNTDAKSAGLYLYVTKFPKSFKGLLSSEVATELNNFINSGGHIAYTTVSTGNRAFIEFLDGPDDSGGLVGFIDKNITSSIETQVFVATPKTSLAVIAHEVVHWEDRISLGLKFYEMRAALFLNSKLSPSFKETIKRKNLVNEFYTFIDESRAFAEELRWQQEHGSTESQSTFRIETEYLFKGYRRPANSFLKLLKKESLKIYNEFVQLYKELSLDSVFFLGIEGLET